jgi:hypothetical protein
MPRNRASRRRAAREVARAPRRQRTPSGPLGTTRLVTRAVAGVAGLAVIVLVLAVLFTAPVSHGNPGRAARGLVIVLAVGALLVWWAIRG